MMFSKGELKRRNTGVGRETDRKIAITMPADWLAHFRREAALEGIPVAQLLRDLIHRGAVDRRGKGKQRLSA